MSRERRLGRGLEALLGRPPEPVGAPIQVPQRTLTRQPQGEGEDPYGGTGTPAYGDPSQEYSQPPDEPVAETPDEGNDSTTLQPESPVAADASSDEPAAAHQGAAAEQPPDTAAETAPDSSEADLESDSQADEPLQVDAGTDDSVDEPFRLSVGRIESNPYQPRQDFDDAEIASLAENIAAHGLLQPVVVRRVGDHYQLVAGERRLRAVVRAGWHEVPARVIEADERQTAELAIVENLQRKDLNPLEKAASFQRYLEQYGATQEELASRLNLDRSTISNLIRLLELPESVQEALRHGHITQGHARALLPLGEEDEQNRFCQQIQREGLSVRQTESLVQETIDAADSEPLGLISRDGKKSRASRNQSEHVASLEQNFRSALGTKVKLTHSNRGRGKLVIHFRNHDEFQRVHRHICGEEAASESQVG